MKSILFVCTGNIFRSMTAEYALKAAMGENPNYRVSSAGTGARPQPMSAVVKTRLLEHGVDPGGHQQHKVTREILAEADLVVAMGLDHRAYLWDRFGHRSWLFNQICFGQESSILDTWEAVPNWEEDAQASISYAISVVDYICEAMPVFLDNIERFFGD